MKWKLKMTVETKTDRECGSENKFYLIELWKKLVGSLSMTHNMKINGNQNGIFHLVPAQQHRNPRTYIGLKISNTFHYFKGLVLWSKL